MGAEDAGRLHKEQWAMVTGQTPEYGKPGVCCPGLPCESHSRKQGVDWKLRIGERLRSTIQTAGMPDLWRKGLWRKAVTTGRELVHRRTGSLGLSTEDEGVKKECVRN